MMAPIYLLISLQEGNSRWFLYYKNEIENKDLWMSTPIGSCSSKQRD